MSAEPPSEALDAALSALLAGEVVGLPTDTVYGLAALARLSDAVGSLFALKGRPEEVAAAVLVDDLDQAYQLAEDGAGVLRRLADAFWPGPLTIVTRRAADAQLCLGGDEATIGLRCPNDPFVRALAQRAGPLAVTSANLHGELPITSCTALHATFPTILVVDGGVRDGAPSSVVSLVGDEPMLLRAGPIAEGAIRAVLGH